MFHEFVLPFHAFVIAHIATGAVGLVSFWVPVMTRKGSKLHRISGRIFVAMMLGTGGIAVGISSITLRDPVTTHPHIAADAALLSGIFGWMMLYLAFLTVNLAWYGIECIRHRRDHVRHRSPLNIALQVILFALSINCMVRGFMLGQLLMVGISFVGIATVATNLYFMYRAKPGPQDWLKEHIKGLVGAGISVYTAFLAFGAVRLMPQMALSPLLWSIPLVTGLSIIIVHWRRLGWRAGPAALALLGIGRRGLGST